MGTDGIDERREVVAKRVEFIELLGDDGPLATRDIVDSLEHSRSTVTRALRELRDADVVEKTENGYDTTLPGKMAARERRRHEAASAAIFDSKELLEPVPERYSPPVELLVGGETHIADEQAPFRPLEIVADRAGTVADEQTGDGKFLLN